MAKIEFDHCAACECGRLLRSLTAAEVKKLIFDDLLPAELPEGWRLEVKVCMRCGSGRVFASLHLDWPEELKKQFLQKKELR